MTLTERLRFETHSPHDELEATPILARLARGELAQTGYVEILKQLYLVHNRLEGLLEKNSNNDQIAACYQSYHPRRDQALADLHYFQPELDAAEIRANAGTERICDYLETIESHNPAHLLGAFYVLEGSNFGAAFLVKIFQRVNNLQEAGVSYYLGHKKDLKPRWDRFKSALNEAFPDAKDQDDIVEIARHTFTLIRDLYLNIDEGEPLARSATSR
jgi:heme oxygenase